MTSTLSHLLLQAADAHPDRPAVWSSTGELTYAELYDRSMCLARALVEHGIEPGDRVVIALAKDVALPVAIFGTLLAGGAYVPIDYLTPPARARAIAADAEAVAVISGPRTMRAMLLGDAYPAHDGPSDYYPALHWLGRGWFDPDRSPERRPVSESLSRIQQLDRWRSPVDVPASALAYILYTSGSTGRPKGVAHTHASALAFVRWAADAVGLRENDVVSQHASPSFDLSVFDFFGAAMAAARLALVPDSTFGRVASLCRFIVDDWCHRLVLRAVGSAARQRRGVASAPGGQRPAPDHLRRRGDTGGTAAASCGRTCRRPVESRTGMARRRPTSARSTT